MGFAALNPMHVFLSAEHDGEPKENFREHGKDNGIRRHGVAVLCHVPLHATARGREHLLD